MRFYQDPDKKLTRRDFEIQAAGNFLSDSEEMTMRQQLITLESDCDDKSFGVPQGVVPWQPFENEEIGRLLNFIYDLADQFEEIYNKGREYENASNG